MASSSSSIIWDCIICEARATVFPRPLMNVRTPVMVPRGIRGSSAILLYFRSLDEPPELSPGDLVRQVRGVKVRLSRRLLLVYHCHPPPGDCWILSELCTNSMRKAVLAVRISPTSAPMMIQYVSQTESTLPSNRNPETRTMVTMTRMIVRQREAAKASFCDNLIRIFQMRRHGMYKTKVQLEKVRISLSQETYSINRLPCPGPFATQSSRPLS